MSGYTDVKNKKMKNLLKKLQNQTDIEIFQGGRHNTKVSCIHTGESYPIPNSHRYINKHIVKDFMKWLVRNEVCTKKEFDEIL